MSFGFPPHFFESREFHLQHEELVALVKAALEDLGWRYKISSRSEVQARIPFLSLGSLGERLKIQILPDGTVAVTSRDLLSVFDFWGRNQKNVQRFFARFEHAERMYRLIETPREPPPAFDADGLSPVERLLGDPTEE
jgi:hypothetical protein